MSFIQAIKSYFTKYATFSGRASRSEFWFAMLFTVLAGWLIDLIAPGQRDISGAIDYTKSSTLSNLWSLATVVPTLAVTWRRLHDVNKSGAYFAWVLLPIVGWILLLIEYVRDSQPGPNRFGEPTK